MDRYKKELEGEDGESNDALLSKILGNMKSSHYKSLPRTTDSDTSSSHYLKNQAGEGPEDKYFTPKKKRELSRYGELSTKMHTPAQPFESVDNSEVIDIKVNDSRPLVSMESDRKLRTSSKSEGRITPLKPVLDEWSIMTEYEVK